MIDLVGNYSYRLIFGDREADVRPEFIREFTIIQDLEGFLPSFRITLTDATGFLSHTIPSDNDMNDVFFDIRKGSLEKNYNAFDFKVYRRNVDAQTFTSNNYTISGFLDIKNLFSPLFSRGFSGSIKDTLLKIAFEEFKINNVDISPSADISKNVIQPQWTNAELLNYLRDNFSSSSENTYFVYFKVKDGRKFFCFNSIQDLVSRPVKYKFIIGDNPYQDFLPVFDYSVFDNYMLYGNFGVKQQDYSYFDYENGRQVDKYLSLDSFPSLTQFHLSDVEDPSISERMVELGRGNSFTKDFEGKAISNLFNRVSGLLKMWVLIWGLENVCPGDMILLKFAQAIVVNTMFTYQYSGYWLVERVVHSIGSTFRTRLLLTRNGIDSDQSTSLVKALNRKK